MTFDQLAAWLNRNGFRTGDGTPYVGGQGVARLVDAVYAYVRNELRLGDAGATPIADAFTDKYGPTPTSRDLLGLCVLLTPAGRRTGAWVKVSLGATRFGNAS